VEVHEVRLGARVAGRVDKVLVAEGEVVSKGRPLVVLSAPELTARARALEAKLAQARAELRKLSDGSRAEQASADEMANAARARWEKMRKGYREEEKRQAQADQEAAEADLRYAEDDHARISKLSRDRASALAELDTARAALQRARARLAAATARLDWMKAGWRPEEVEEARAEWRKLDHSSALLRATRPAEIEAARGRVEEAEAALQEARINLAETSINAAEDCLVEVIAVRPGDIVQAGQPVLRALRASDLWVKTYVPETELGKVLLGQEAEVTMDSYPGRRFKGKVYLIGAESEFTPRNVQTIDERRHQMFGIRVHVEDPQGHFKSGMAAEVFLPLAR
jgi:multidrug resistance efflux pump